MADIIKALSEAVNAGGGFTVPDILASEILALIQAKSVAIDDMQRVTMTSDTLLLPTLTAGSTARFPAESITITGADVGFGQITLSAKKVAALMTASTELLEDSKVNVARIITEQFGKDLALAIDSAILGTGSNLGGAGLGYTGGTANTLSVGTLSWQALISGGNLILTANHDWPDTLYTHPVNIRSLMLLTDSTARPIFNQEVFGSPMLREGVIGTILGMKVKPTTQLTTSSIIMGKSGDFGYYGERRQLQTNRFYNIGTDDVVFQSNLRVAFAVKYSNSFCLLRNVA